LNNYGEYDVCEGIDDNLSGKNVIYADKEKSIYDIEKVLQKTNPNAKITSVSGFSGGGPNTLRAMESGKYKFIGLIDPYIDKELSRLPANTKMISRAKNWTGYPNVKKVHKDNVLKYSSYNIKSSTISSSEFIPGPPSVPNYIANSEIIKGTMDGTGSVSPSSSASSSFTTMNGREGFDNHGYEDPTAKYCTYPNSMGCRNAILQKQINPLSQIAQDYQNQTAQMNANEGNIDSTISQYNYYHGIMNNNNKYDFSGNQSFTMEDISIQNVMQQDTKQLLLQENNFYIAGSILTTTLLVSAIYLAR
jgi:hypothetical protein